MGQSGVAIKARKLSVLIDNLAGHDHRPHARHLRSLDHRVEHWRFAIEIGVADLLPVDERHVGGLADLERADLRGVRGRFGAAARRHSEHLCHGRNTIVHAWLAMGP